MRNKKLAIRKLFYRGLVCAFFFSSVFAFGQAKLGISGAVEWDKMEINAVVALDLASAGLKLPTGRTQGEAIIASEYLRLIRPEILNLQVDSSSTVADLVERGEWSLFEIENYALQARAVPPALSPDFNNLLASYTLGIVGVRSALARHSRTAEIPRTLDPVPAPSYTGIVIIASDNQPVHGTRSSALLQPCLFPKIWDSDMKLIFERNMLKPEAGAMAYYFPLKSIFAGGPSGLSPDISAIVGDHPLRIFARGAFGMKPTDPIISPDDALLIMSTEANRNLLSEGRLVIILDDSMLKNDIK
ncbi:MAG: polymerase [Treponema sp.]|jgi:hypothetical protein|nr:polymerase [Treponema sp.]